MLCFLPPDAIYRGNGGDGFCRSRARKDKELGQIFLRDTAFCAVDGYAVEQLIGVGGTKKFSKASASMEIGATRL
jgi:hypothetical protein